MASNSHPHLSVADACALLELPVGRLCTISKCLAIIDVIQTTHEFHEEDINDNNNIPIFEACKDIIKSNTIKQVQVLKLDQHGKFTKQVIDIDIITANSIITQGITMAFRSEYFPISRQDIQLELVILIKSVTQLATQYVRKKFGLHHNLTFEQIRIIYHAKPIYDVINKHQLYYSKTILDNITNINPNIHDVPNLDVLKTKIIGTGTFGTTYQVYDINRQQYYAIKRARIPIEQPEQVVSSYGVYDVPENIPTWARELYIADVFCAYGDNLHPSLVKQYGHHFDQTTCTAYFIMEYIEQDPQLTRVLHDAEDNCDPYEPSSKTITTSIHNTFTVDDVINITTQLAIAIKALHEMNIAHRDIKPTNFMLLPNIQEEQEHQQQQKYHKIKLMDYGLAKIFSSTNVDRLSSTNLGNDMNKAPELQCEKEYNTYLSDYYSLGINTLHLLFGYSPGFFHFSQQNQRLAEGPDDLNTSRIEMANIDGFIQEYKGYCKYNDLQEICEQRLAELLTKETFIEALGYLIDPINPQNREKFFQSTFFQNAEKEYNDKNNHNSNNNNNNIQTIQQKQIDDKFVRGLPIVDNSEHYGNIDVSIAPVEQY